MEFKLRRGRVVPWEEGNPRGEELEDGAIQIQCMQEWIGEEEEERRSLFLSWKGSVRES